MKGNVFISYLTKKFLKVNNGGAKMKVIKLSIYGFLILAISFYAETAFAQVSLGTPTSLQTNPNPAGPSASVNPPSGLGPTSSDTAPASGEDGSFELAPIYTGLANRVFNDEVSDAQLINYVRQQNLTAIPDTNYYRDSLGNIHDVAVVESQIVDTRYNNFMDNAGNSLNSNQVRNILNGSITDIAMDTANVTVTTYNYSETPVYGFDSNGDIVLTNFLIDEVEVSNISDVDINLEEGRIVYDTDVLETKDKYDYKGDLVIQKIVDGEEAEAGKQLVFSTLTGLIQQDKNGNQYEWIKTGNEVKGYILKDQEGKTGFYYLGDSRGETVDIVTVRGIKNPRGIEIVNFDLDSYDHFEDMLTALGIDGTSSEEIQALIFDPARFILTGTLYKIGDNLGSDSESVNATFMTNLSGKITSYKYKTDLGITFGGWQTDDSTDGGSWLDEVSITYESITAALGITEFDLDEISLDRSINEKTNAAIQARLNMGDNAFMDLAVDDSGNVTVLYAVRIDGNGKIWFFNDQGTVLKKAAVADLGNIGVDSPFVFNQVNGTVTTYVADEDGVCREETLYTIAANGTVTSEILNASDIEAPAQVAAIFGANFNVIEKVNENENTYIIEQDGIYYRVEFSGSSDETRSATVYKFTQDLISKASIPSFAEVTPGVYQRVTPTYQTVLSSIAMEHFKNDILGLASTAVLDLNSIAKSFQISEEKPGDTLLYYEVILSAVSGTQIGLIVSPSGEIELGIKEVVDSATSVKKISLYDSSGAVIVNDLTSLGFSSTNIKVDLNSITRNAENDFTIAGINTGADLRVFLEGTTWRGIAKGSAFAAVSGDGTEAQVRFWADLSGDLSAVGNLRIVKGVDFGADLSKLSYDFDNDIVIRKDSEGNYTVFKLGQDQPQTSTTWDAEQPEPLPANVLNKVEEQFTAVFSKPDGSKLATITVDGTAIELTTADLALLGIGGANPEEIMKNIAPAVYGYNAAQKLLILNANNGFRVIGMKEKNSKIVLDLKDDGALKELVITDWATLKAAIDTALGDNSDVDITSDGIVFDIENQRVKVAATITVGDEERVGYGYKLFDVAGNAVSTEGLEPEEWLTPAGLAYNETLKVLRLFRHEAASNLEWDDFSAKFTAGGAISDGTGQGTATYIITVDTATGRLTKIQINAYNIDIKWENGEYKITGGAVTVPAPTSSNPNATRSVEIDKNKSSLDLNGNHVRIETKSSGGSRYILDIKEDDGKIAETNITIFSTKRLEWISSTSEKTTYELNEDGEWIVETQEVIYSGSNDPDNLLGSDYIKYTYSELIEGTELFNLRTGTENYGGREAVSWTERSEDGSFSQGDIVIDGSRMNRETGEITTFANETVKRILASSLYGTDGKLNSLGSSLVELGMFTEAELAGYRTSNGYIDIRGGATPEEIEQLRIGILRAGGIGSLLQDEAAAKAVLDALMGEGGSVQAAYDKFFELYEAWQGAQKAAALKEQNGTAVMNFFSGQKQQFDELEDIKGAVAYDSQNTVLKASIAEAGEPKAPAEGGQAADPNGSSGGSGGQQQGEQPPGNGDKLPPSAKLRNELSDRLTGAQADLFGPGVSYEDRVNKIFDDSKYADVAGDWATRAGLSQDELKAKLLGLTANDARAGYMAKLGMQEKQIQHLLSIMGDKDAAVAYLMQVLGITEEEALALYNQLLNMTQDDAIKMFLESLGYSEEEINAFMDVFNAMKQEMEAYLRDTLGIKDDALVAEILSMSREEAENKLQEFGYSDAEISAYFDMQDAAKQYLSDVLGITDADTIDAILSMDAADAEQYLRDNNVNIDVDAFLALGSDSEKLQYLIDYFVNEGGLDYADATDKAAAIIAQLNTLETADAIETYLNENWSQLQSEDWVDKLMENNNTLEVKEFLLEIGLTEDEVQEFFNQTADHARLNFLMDVVGLEQWTAQLIVGKEITEEGKLTKIDYKAYLKSIVEAVEEAANDLGYDQAVASKVAEGTQEAAAGTVTQNPAGSTQVYVVGDTTGETSINQLMPNIPGKQQVAAPQTTSQFSDAEMDTIVSNIIVALLKGEMTPDNALEIAKSIISDVVGSSSSSVSLEAASMASVPPDASGYSGDAPWVKAGYKASEAGKWAANYKNYFIENFGTDEGLSNYQEWVNTWLEWFRGGEL